MTCAFDRQIITTLILLCVASPGTNAGTIPLGTPALLRAASLDNAGSVASDASPTTASRAATNEDDETAGIAPPQLLFLLLGIIWFVLWLTLQSRASANALAPGPTQLRSSTAPTTQVASNNFGVAIDGEGDTRSPSSGGQTTSHVIQPLMSNTAPQSAASGALESQPSVPGTSTETVAEEPATTAPPSGIEASPPDSARVDDLTKVEGIGPKISEHLQNAGIKTFAALSAASFEQLRGILDNAGKRYRVHDPTTWPHQAALAAAEKWDELAQLQDELSGGR